MWPFRKKPVLPPPDDVVEGDVRATYSDLLEGWEFQVDGIDFTYSGRSLDRALIPQAREAVVMIKRLQPEIDRNVLEQLEVWPCDKSKRELLSVSLDEYPESRSMELSYIGDDSWGDLGIDITIEDGRIVDASAGD